MAEDKKNPTFSGFPKYLLDNKILNEEDIIKSLSASLSFIDDIYYQKYMLEYELAWAIAKYNKYTYLDLNYYSEKLITLDLDLTWVRHNRILPLKIKKDTLFIILDNPSALSKAFIDLREKYQVKYIITFVGERAKLNRLIENLIMLKQNPNNSTLNNDEQQFYQSTQKEKIITQVENKKPSDVIDIPVIPEPIKNVDNQEIKQNKGEVIAEEIKENNQPKSPVLNRKDEVSNKKAKTNKKSEIEVSTPPSDIDETNKVITKYIQRVLVDAVNSDVDEIHFEPYEKNYRIRFKQYGELYESFVAPSEIKNNLSQKLKSISNMDINDNKPQYGKFSLKISELQNIDFKAVSCPTIFGEKIVLNIISNGVNRLSFDNLGYNQQQSESLKNITNKEAGLCIFSGPANSGKTYSMYNLINEVNKKNKNIYTIEEVVGFNLAGANQIRINKDLSYDDIFYFIDGQSPDAILIDNINDLNIAKKTFNLSRKGRLIASSINSPTIKDVFKDLFAMGFSGYDIASTVKMVSTQRLLPKLCNECKTHEVLTKSMLIRKGFSEEDITGLDVSWKIYKQEGCSGCNHTGHKGVVPLFDILIIDEEIKDALISKEPFEVLSLIESKTQELNRLKIEKIKKGEVSLSILNKI